MTQGRARTRFLRGGGGAHLAEGRPVILSSLGQTVGMLTVCLEEASCAQLVEWLQCHTRGVPEPYGAILVAARGKTSSPRQNPAYSSIHSSSDHSLSTYYIRQTLTKLLYMASRKHLQIRAKIY